ncbi:MAG: hypothetical protein K5644_09835 [Lachnospiraceae bacterium]|nr:hypothetical protein [Lachnospiraceae bacterium]
MLYKLERKIGKFAIPHLINYILIGYVIGYVLFLTQSFSGINILGYLTLEPYYVIHEFQIWRIFTWVLMPPTSGTGLMGIFFMVIMMFFYFQLGNTLEATWGSFKFNLYMFGGMFFTILGAFLGYLIYYLIGGGAEAAIGIGYYVSTNYLNMSIFLAFALCYPNMQVLFMFIIPLKMKWMAIIYAVITGYQVVISLMVRNYISCIMIVASLLNFGIFWLITRNFNSVSAGRSNNKWSRFTGGGGASGGGFNRNGYRGQGGGAGFRPYHDNNSSSQNSGSNTSSKRNQPIGRHKCAICGKTDITNPEMTFRFCSKCNGNYEYCENHLYTHVHKN